MINNDESLESNGACEKNNCAPEKDDLFRKHGLISQQDKEKARKIGIQSIIAPVYHAGFEDVSLISSKIEQLNVAGLLTNSNSPN